MVFGVSFINIALVLGGLGGFFLSAILGFGGLDFILETSVQRMMRLVPESRIWPMWETIPVDIYLRVYMFNITNAERLNMGEKPVLRELGPYVYLIKMKKVDIVSNDTEDVVKYRQVKTYSFVPEMSVGSDSDQVTYINIMFLVTAHITAQKSDIDAVHEGVDNLLSEKGEKLYTNSSVRDFLFDGISLQAYVEMIEDPMVKMGGGASLPEEYADGKFAFFKGKNGSDDGVWVVHTGVTRTEDFARVVSVNGKTELDIWKGRTCNSLNGTDAQMYQPFVKPGVTNLQGYIPDMCRSITWKYIGPVETEGIQCARFHLADFLTPPEDPDNSCFCPHDNLEQCNVTGLGYMEPCKGAPMIVSKPHFYKVHESILQKVEGLNPNEQDHEARLDLHPFTGTTVKASVRFQFSIELINNPAMPSFRGVTGAFVPILWMEQGATLGGKNKILLSILDMQAKLWPILKYLWMLSSLSVVGLGVFLCFRNRKGNAVTEIVDKKTVGELEKEFVFVFSKNALAMKQ